MSGRQGRERPDGRMTQAERTARAEAGMIEAAIELLTTAGIQGTTLVAIGDKSGYSRGLVTARFGSKDGLIDALIDNYFAVVEPIGERLDRHGRLPAHVYERILHRDRVSRARTDGRWRVPNGHRR